MDTVKMNPPMPEPNKCPQCGTPLPSGALAGLCPACLLKMGAAADTVTDAKQKTFTPPDIAELASKFPQLEILELIGKGGMGAVYKARQKQLDRIVALKILPPGIGDEPAFAERFAREAKALAKLNHPNIVTLYEFGDAGGQFYFLMEFVDGVNLRQLLAGSRVSAREALAIVPQICDALQFAHDQGIVHRDIKPENILLDRRGRVKVADFGLAKIIEPGRADLPVSPNIGAAQQHGPTGVMGTPNYMSPEQKENPGEVDNRADIYALGVVFYQMLTGELPGKTIVPPSTKVQIDVRLDEIVLRALEKNPELRYQQVREVKTGVETIIGSRGRESAQTESGKLKAESGKPVGKNSWLFSPLVSPEVREIAAHLTKEERSEAALYGLLWGGWVVTVTFGNFWLIKSFPAPGSWLVASVIAALFFASLQPWFRLQRRFLYSTAWAKEHGYTAGQVKLFSFSPRNLWYVLLFAGVVILLAFGQPRLFTRLSGISELTASLKEDAARTKELTAQLAAQDKSFYIGQTNFPLGDSIEITSLVRTKDRLMAKGHYHLVSADSARLALYITTTNDIGVLTDSRQQMQISKGSGDFELVHTHLVPGLPHVSMYADGNPFAGIYFGNQDEAVEESKLDLGHYQMPDAAETWSPALAPGEKPDVQKIRDEIKTLMEQNDYEGALQRQLWYFIHAVQFGEINPVRLSFGIMNWHELGQRYPKAKQALIEIRDRDVREFSAGRGYAELFLEVQSLNRELHDDEATLALFKEIYQQDKQLAQPCYYYVQDSLMQNGDYDLCLKCIGDPQEHFESFQRSFEMQIENQQRMAEMRKKYPMPIPPFAGAFRSPDMGQMATNNFVGQVCKLVEILVATGHKDGAEKIRDEAIGVLDDARLKSAVGDAEEKVRKKLMEEGLKISNTNAGTVTIPLSETNN
jgi:serine/threonine protein kinase